MKKILFVLMALFTISTSFADETNSPIVTALNASTYTAITMSTIASARHCKSVSAYTEDASAWTYATDVSGTDAAVMPAGLIPNFGCNKETSILFYAKASAGTPNLVTFVGAPQ